MLELNGSTNALKIAKTEVKHQKHPATILEFN